MSLSFWCEGKGGDLNTLSSGGGGGVIDYCARVIIHNMLFYLLWSSKVLLL